LDELASLAINTYKTALENGDTLVAKDTLSMVMKLGERREGQQARREDSALEVFFRDRKERMAREKKIEESIPAEVIDVTVIREGEPE
jgi:hypothetical protein